MKVPWERLKHLLTCIGSNDNAIMNVQIQLTTPANAIAMGRGPCLNSSDPIIIGIGPEIQTQHKC
jgi:hypothetical protein